VKREQWGDMGIESLEKLEAWKRAKEFSLKVYRKVLPLLPPEEKWGMNQQLRRSALSIPANIAEGHGRFYYLDNVRFCYNSRGSLEETLSHLMIAHELDYIPYALYQELRQNGEELFRILNGYIAYLKRSKQGANDPGAEQALREQALLYLTDSDDPSEND
jgi:four helix bundle protein